MFKTSRAARLLGCSAPAAAVLVWLTWSWRPAEGFETVEVALGDMRRTVTLPGILLPKTRASVFPSHMGRVERVWVARGDAVQKGARLLQLGAGELERDLRRRELALEKALLRLESAGFDSERAQRDPGPTASRRLAEIEVRQAQLDCEAARQAVRESTLRSPIEGVVVHVGVRDGDFIGPSGTAGAAAVVIAQPGLQTVEIEADEFEAMQVEKGAAAWVFLEGRPAPTRGRVSEAPVLKKLSQVRGTPSTFSISVDFDGHPPEARIGQSARVEIEVAGRSQVPMAPLTAIFRHEGKDYVLEVVGGEYVRREVLVGLTDDAVAELISGPAPGAVVAIGNSELLRRSAFAQR